MGHVYSMFLDFIYTGDRISSGEFEMRKIRTALVYLLSVSCLPVSAAEPNRDFWVLDGYYVATVLSQNITDSPNTPFEGLVVQCSSSTGLARVKVQDLKADKGTMVKYKTDRASGEFTTEYPFLVATSASSTNVNDKLLDAIINGNTITFEIGNTKATYALKGSGKAIKAMKSCGKTYSGF